jgi:hypothetical protein
VHSAGSLLQADCAGDRAAGRVAADPVVAWECSVPSLLVTNPVVLSNMLVLSVKVPRRCRRRRDHKRFPTLLSVRQGTRRSILTECGDAVAGVWQSLASLPVFDAESIRQTFISPEVWIDAARRPWL